MAWFEHYEALPPKTKARVDRWLKLQVAIADSLGMNLEVWIEQFVQPGLSAPFDFRFLQQLVPSEPGDDGQALDFEAHAKLGLGEQPKRALRASNQMGRLSETLQAHLTTLIQNPEPAEFPVPPSDVGVLIKLMPREKGLGKVSRRMYRKIRVFREGQDIGFKIAGGRELSRQPAEVLVAMLNRAH